MGGLIGQNSGVAENGHVEASYATGAVSGMSRVGGLVGYNTSFIQTSYATGAVSGSSYVGGLVGYNDINATVASSYSPGAVSATGR